MLWLQAFRSSPSFKEARDFKAEQRERERESGDPLFRGTDVRGVHQRSSNERVPVDEAPPTRLIFHAVNLSA